MLLVLTASGPGKSIFMAHIEAPAQISYDLISIAELIQDPTIRDNVDAALDEYIASPGSPRCRRRRAACRTPGRGSRPTPPPSGCGPRSGRPS